MTNFYTSDKNVSIDESMMLWRNQSIMQLRKN